MQEKYMRNSCRYSLKNFVIFADKIRVERSITPPRSQPSNANFSMFSDTYILPKNDCHFRQQTDIQINIFFTLFCLSMRFQIKNNVRYEYINESSEP